MKNKSANKYRILESDFQGILHILMPEVTRVGSFGSILNPSFFMEHLLAGVNPEDVQPHA